MCSVWPSRTAVVSSWWRNQMDTSSPSLAICAGNSPVTGEFPAQRPVTRSFDVFFDRCLYKRLGKPRRYRAHYDVIVIKYCILSDMFLLTITHGCSILEEALVWWKHLAIFVSAREVRSFLSKRAKGNEQRSLSKYREYEYHVTMLQQHRSAFRRNQGTISIYICRLINIAIPMLKIRLSRDRLIFNMGIPIHRVTIFILRRAPEIWGAAFVVVVVVVVVSLNQKQLSRQWFGTPCYVYRDSCTLFFIFATQGSRRNVRNFSHGTFQMHLLEWSLFQIFI